jgi:hypothetical protein
MQGKPQETGKKIWFPEGRIYFSRDTERRFFFIMTLLMAAFGIAVKMGWIK